MSESLPVCSASDIIGICSLVKDVCMMKDESYPSYVKRLVGFIRTCGVAEPVSILNIISYRLQEVDVIVSLVTEILKDPKTCKVENFISRLEFHYSVSSENDVYEAFVEIFRYKWKPDQNSYLNIDRFLRAARKMNGFQLSDGSLNMHNSFLVYRLIESLPEDYRESAVSQFRRMNNPDSLGNLINAIHETEFVKSICTRQNLSVMKPVCQSAEEDRSKGENEQHYIVSVNLFNKSDDSSKLFIMDSGANVCVVSSKDRFSSLFPVDHHVSISGLSSSVKTQWYGYLKKYKVLAFLVENVS